MTKAIAVAILSMILLVQVSVVYAQAPSDILALHTIEAPYSTSSAATVITLNKEEASAVKEPETRHEALAATEQVSNRSMTEELIAWVQQEKSQPKRKLYRLR